MKAGDVVRYVGPSLKPNSPTDLLRVIRVGEYAGEPRVFVEHGPASRDGAQAKRERPIREEHLELVRSV